MVNVTQGKPLSKWFFVEPQFLMHSYETTILEDSELNTSPVSVMSSVCSPML